MEPATILGLLAGTLTTVSFIPQVIKSFKMKETRDISLLMYIILCIGVLSWLIYGILIKDIPVIAANGAALILTAMILISKIRYG
ncbi:SemiSWEET transporter [Candidatus Woesearchaeota archaeon]|nr:SemiSWEET transporter [Candidatus Woesearchaeota archaeon]